VFTPQPTTTLLPYANATAVITGTSLSPSVTTIPTLGPTPTPFIHVVQKDDTLLGIAYRYGVSMDALLAANPGIDPRIISIDQEIIIPLTEGDPISNLLPTATPVPLQLSEVSCYPNQVLSFWCITTLENDSEDPLEAVSVVLSIWDGNGAMVQAKTAYSLLNIIPVGAEFPLAVNFSDFSGDYAYAIVSPVSAFPARTVEERYISFEVFRDVDEPSDDFTSWRIAGRLVSKDAEGRSATRAAILIVALDDGDQIIGFRKLKLSSVIGAGDEVLFETEVFSLGPAIERIEIYAEGPVLTEED